MVKISNLSDLEIEVTFRDRDCKEQPVPDHSFLFEWFTSYNRKVIFASYDANTKTFTNCKIVNGKLVCCFDDPELGNGRIKSRKTYYLIDPDFPDLTRKVVLENSTDAWIGEGGFSKTQILTVDDSKSCCGNVEVPVVLDCAPILWYYQYVMLSDGQILGTSDGKAFMVEIK